MLQIRKIRDYTPMGATQPHTFDANLDPDLKIPDYQTLIQKTEDFIEKIPENERYNLFYTVGHVPEGAGKKREWVSQDVIPFDIDNIHANDDGTFDPKYLDAVSEALGIPKEKLGIAFSGHGLHVLVLTNSKITKTNFFDDNKIYYETICSKINDKLREKGLEGDADTSSFAPNRLLRLPQTLNRKANKPERKAYWINRNVEPLEFDLKKLSGLPDVKKSDQVTERQLKYFSIDTPSVERGCDFLKWCKANPNELNEPQWYASLSILARLDNGADKCHEYSKNHYTYSEFETDRKIEHALKASGPRTCDNIDSLWGNCRACPNYKQVNSPIAIKGPDFIATKATGFHLLNGDGKHVPQYEDLRRFYYQEFGPYMNIGKYHYRWDEKYWREMEDKYAESFAQSHFHPIAKNHMRSEFRGIVEATERYQSDWFEHRGARKINLANGVLDIDTLELEPHSPDFGFRHCFDYDYDPECQSPTFDQFLRDVTCNDVALEQNLLEFMGYALSNDQGSTGQKLLILTGEGSNGKSTFLEILLALGGPGARALGPLDLKKEFGRQMLDGALFNILEEVPVWTDKNFWEDIKGLTTGAWVTASKKYKDVYQFKNRAKFIFTCNELPKGTEPTPGFFRRLIIVPFDGTFSHQLGNIKVGIADEIIENELPGVLNRCLEAYHGLKKRHYEFTFSQKAQDALETYKSDVDSVRAYVEENWEVNDKGIWIDENCQKGVLDHEELGTVATIEAIYLSYTLWMGEQGNPRSIVAQRGFKKRLTRTIKSMAKSVKKELVKRSRVNGRKTWVLTQVAGVITAENQIF